MIAVEVHLWRRTCNRLDKEKACDAVNGIAIAAARNTKRRGIKVRGIDIWTQEYLPEGGCLYRASILLIQRPGRKPSKMEGDRRYARKLMARHARKKKWEVEETTAVVRAEDDADCWDGRPVVLRWNDEPQRGEWGMPARKGRVTPERFVTTWMVYRDIDRVAEELGMSLEAVKDRARYYISKGLPLPSINNFDARRVRRSRKRKVEGDLPINGPSPTASSAEPFPGRTAVRRTCRGAESAGRSSGSG